MAILLVAFARRAAALHFRGRGAKVGRWLTVDAAFFEAAVVNANIGIGLSQRIVDDVGRGFFAFGPELVGL